MRILQFVSVVLFSYSRWWEGESWLDMDIKLHDRKAIQAVVLNTYTMLFEREIIITCFHTQKAVSGLLSLLETVRFITNIFHT